MQHLRRRRTAGLLASFLAVVALPGCLLYMARYSGTSQTAANLQGVARVLVDSGNGAVRVRHHPGLANARIDVFRHARGVSSADALEWGKKIVVDIARDTAAGTLSIVTRFPEDGDDRSLSADIHIELPPGLDLDLDVANGEIDVAGARGVVRAATRNGAITIDLAEGAVDVRTDNGQIELSRIRGSVRANTENGRIAASDVGGALDLVTRNGAIELDVARVERRPGDRISATTANGAIELVLPGDFPADLDLSTANGSVDVEPASFGAETTERAGGLTLRINGGGPELRARSENGAVRLRAAE